MNAYNLTPADLPAIMAEVEAMKQDRVNQSKNYNNTVKLLTTTPLCPKESTPAQAPSGNK